MNTKNTKVLARAIAPATAIIMIASGCSQLRTVEAPYGAPNTGRAYAGIHYFLPKGLITIEGKSGGANGDYTVTIGRENEPDRHARYRLVQGKSYFHDDKSKFGVDANGLLTSVVDTTSESKVGDIIKDLTTTTINVGKIYTKIQSGVPKTGMFMPDNDANAAPKPFKVTFDPFDEGEKATAGKQMAFAKFGLEVQTDHEEKRGYAAGSETADPRIEGHLSHQGVFYRPQTTVKVRVYSKGNTAVSVAKHVPIPDVNSLAVYSFARGALVKKTQKVTFNQGEPTTVDYDRPSELKAFTAIPVQITTDVLSALGEAPALGQFLWKPKAPVDPNADVKAKTAQLDAESARLDAEKALLEKQAEVNKKKKEVDDAKNGNLPAPKTGMFYPGTGLFLPEDPLNTSNIEDSLKAANKRIDDLGNEVAKLHSPGLPPPPTPPTPPPTLTPTPTPKPTDEGEK